MLLKYCIYYFFFCAILEKFQTIKNAWFFVREDIIHLYKYEIKLNILRKCMVICQEQLENTDKFCWIYFAQLLSIFF
jgi:hypothetical protein